MFSDQRIAAIENEVRNARFYPSGPPNSLHADIEYLLDKVRSQQAEIEQLQSAILGLVKKGYNG